MQTPLRLGTWLSIGSPVIAELAAQSGLDWVLLDLEHGCAGEAALPDQLRALRGSDTLGIVRVPALLPDLIARVLDWGADGIMLPHVRSADEATACVAAMRYPPRGERGVSRTVAAHGYGRHPLSSRAEPLFLPQIEDLAGLRAACGISAVEGVDALFVGPADLGHALAHADPSAAPDFEACLDEIAASALACGKEAGILLRDASLCGSHRERGYSWIAVQSDLGILRQAYDSMREDLQ